MRCDERTVAGTLWALTPDAYLRLVPGLSRGGSGPVYETECQMVAL